MELRRLTGPGRVPAHHGDVEQVATHSPRAGFVEHLADGVCRRAFSSPEAMAYELTIAPVLAAVLEPLNRPLLTDSRTLDVGCGGGQIAKRLVNGQLSVVDLGFSRSQVRRFDRQAGSGAGRPGQSRGAAIRQNAYLRFAMRTVVGVAPTRDRPASSFDGLPVAGLNVQRVDGLSFLLATAAAK